MPGGAGSSPGFGASLASIDPLKRLQRNADRARDAGQREPESISDGP